MSEERASAVLAEHVRGDWSDRTYSCAGCRDRYEAQTQAEWESASPERRKEMHAELFRIIKPDWSIDDYNAHVAAALATAGYLREPLDLGPVEALPDEWERAVHEHHCGTPPSCGEEQGCPGNAGRVEARELRRLIRAALAALTTEKPSGEGT